MTVGVIVTTYFPEGDIGRRRMEYAQQAVGSWNQHLEHIELSHYHIADDGSDPESIAEFHEWLSDLVGYGDGNLVTISQQKRRGVGASLNVGIEMMRLSDVDVFGYFVDDWVLDYSLNIQPWVDLLRNREHIGMVRIGMPHPGITGRVDMEPEGWVLRLNRHNFVYGMRPALYHTRFFDAYGMFDEMKSALECERMYNERFCKGQGPDIVLALPSPFTPTAQDIVLSAIEPNGR